MLYLRRLVMVFLLVMVIFGLYGGYRLYRRYTNSLDSGPSNSNSYIAQWRDDPTSRPELNTERGTAACPGAPFILPSSGLIGLLWGDPAGPYSETHRHSGLDIFGDGEPNTVPIYAVYDGWLTREDTWKSTVIIRHDDPLQPGRTIWTYYTHMASIDGETSFVAPDFPPGTYGLPVKQGTLLGHQGEYAGVGMAAILMHVHLSIVQSNADGAFLNEAAIENTLDPSPYFGLEVNFDAHADRPIRCKPAQES